MPIESPTKWDRIAKLYEQRRDDAVRPGPGFKHDMLALVAKLGKDRDLGCLQPGLSHYMLTLAKEDNKRSLTVGWQSQGWYHISACSTVEIQNAIDTLQDTLQHIMEMKFIDKILVVYPDNITLGYGEQIGGWDNITSYYQDQASGGSVFAQQVLTLLPEIRVCTNIAEAQIWASRSLRLLGIDVPGSRRFVTISSLIVPAIMVCEKIVVSSEQVIPILQDFSKRL